MLIIPDFFFLLEIAGATPSHGYEALRPCSHTPKFFAFYMVKFKFAIFIVNKFKIYDTHYVYYKLLIYDIFSLSLSIFVFVISATNKLWVWLWTHQTLTNSKTLKKSFKKTNTIQPHSYVFSPSIDAG